MGRNSPRELFINLFRLGCFDFRTCEYKILSRFVIVCIITHMNSAQIIKRLESEGWTRVGGKGDHMKFKHPGKPGHVVVPHPRKDMPIGTLRNIYRQAGWNWR